MPSADCRQPDIVYITGLRVPTVIGVHAWEQAQTRDLFLDLEMDVDMQAAFASDDVQDVVDYDTLSRQLLALGAASSFKLVETFAHRCALLVLEQPRVSAVRVRVSKPGAVPEAVTVGVVVHLRRADLG